MEAPISATKPNTARVFTITLRLEGVMVVERFEVVNTEELFGVLTVVRRSEVLISVLSIEVIHTTGYF
jgi:hypothetical protein